jgi:phosphate transporter
MALKIVVMLAMGGISLGEAVKSSGLLATITESIRPHLMQMSLFTCTVIICGILAVVTSFISHTVGALIVLPIIAEIGKSLPSNEPRTLVMCAALMCSGGMALPVSSFPNMNAISLEDSKGNNWLTVKDFLKIGIVGSLLAWVTVSLVAYAAAVIIKFG